ncbi:MAG: hypothetical protein HDT15_01980 [Oscillibacter sp.]|nr:hypothetical protein [Oscillibacter sp.]
MKFSEKFKVQVTEYVEKLRALWTEGQYFQAIIRITGPAIVIALILFLVTQAIAAITRFLRLHYAQLIFAALVIWAFVGWLEGYKERKQKRQMEYAREEERKIRVAQRDYASTKDATYTAQGKMLFSVARELVGVDIIPPMRPSDIYSPGRTIPKLNGAVILCQFMLQKDGDEVDTDFLQHMLQTKIDQRLATGDFPGIPEVFHYNGRTYSGFCIDHVEDGHGYVEIYTALVNEAYCKYCENRDLSRDVVFSPIDRRDIDY